MNEPNEFSETTPKVPPFVYALGCVLRKALLVLPLLTMFVSVLVVGSHVFCVLAMLNFIAFGVVLFLERQWVRVATGDEFVCFNDFRAAGGGGASGCRWV